MLSMICGGQLEALERSKSERFDASTGDGAPATNMIAVCYYSFDLIHHPSSTSLERSQSSSFHPSPSTGDVSSPLFAAPFTERLYMPIPIRTIIYLYLYLYISCGRLNINTIKKYIII